MQADHFVPAPLQGERHTPGRAAHTTHVFTDGWPLRTRHFPLWTGAYTTTPGRCKYICRPSPHWTGVHLKKAARDASACISSAATDESTPPDMATTARRPRPSSEAWLSSSAMAASSTAGGGDSGGAPCAAAGRSAAATAVTASE